MPLSISENDKPRREAIPAELYTAIFCAVVDIGTQETSYGMKRQVRITWEIPELRNKGTDEDGKEYDTPRFIAKKYTYSFNEKSTLRKHLQAARGKPFTPEELKGFDLFSVIGHPCFLQVDHFTPENGDGPISYVGNVVKYKGTDKPALESVPMRFAIDEWDGTAKPDDIPEWLWGIIMTSPEAQAKGRLFGGQAATGSASPAGGTDMDDDIPF